MVKIRISALFGLLLLGVGGFASAKPTTVVPDKWFVELADPPALAFEGGPVHSLQAESGPRAVGKSMQATAPHLNGRPGYDPRAPEVQAYVAHLAQERNRVLDRASVELGRTVEAASTYHHVFNGFVAVMSKKEVGQLAKLPGVRAIRPVLAHKLELDAGPEVIGARNVHAGVGGLPANGGEGTVIGIIDSGINWDHQYFSDDDLASGHVFSNPYESQLGECSKATVACNNKLVGVYDFTVEETKGKDPDGHGTHVASTAAGVPIEYTLSSTGPYVFDTTGVAPHANIISYKVCYKDHPTDDDLDDQCEGSAIVDAWEQAITDGVDVINYSIGGSPSDPWSSSSWLLNIWSAGIAFVTSAGNEGPAPGTVGSPADAPWTFAVGSSTHGRLVGDRATVADLEDRFVIHGNGPEVSGMISAPVVSVDDVSGDLFACSSFQADALDGAIAFLQRGHCTFETKVSNAAQAGAVAVLVFNDVEGPPIVMGGLSQSAIPAAMMSLEDGTASIAAIAAANEPTATLFADGYAIRNADWQDLVSGFSARGPVEYPGVMKPNVVAPGSNIAAGWHDGPESLAFSSGTSMASPHVAGAVALLKSIHPEWTLDIIQSALETTSETDPLRYGDGAATFFDRGAGRVRVDRAADAGLFLPITRNDFSSANPATGGDPRKLNLSGLWDQECAGSCTFERTVEALGGGSWDVSVQGDISVTVSPQSFTLAEGERQQLSIEVNAEALPTGALGEASILLTPSSGAFSVQKLTLGVQSAAIELPDELQLEVSDNRGQENVSVSAGVLTEPVFRTSALVKPERESFSLPQDDSRDDPYQDSDGLRTFLADVPDDTLMLIAEVVSSDATDIDLFVGRDDNGNGEADESEEQCRSTSPEELEECLIESPASGQWWILVQNWSASGPSDDVELDWAVLPASNNPSLVVSGPGAHEAGTLELDLYWDEPRMRRNERWFGALGVRGTPDDSSYLGVVPVFMTRTAQLGTPTTAMFAEETMPVVVPGNTSHRRLYIDVPDTAEDLSISVQGQEGVDVAIQRLDFDELAESEPDTPDAPDSTALASGASSADGVEFDLPAVGQPLFPGRYFVVLDNTTTTEKRVRVTASFSESSGMPPRFSVWSPKFRETNQGIDWNAGATGTAIWYTYDDAGVPTFYNAVGSVADDRSSWTAGLLRTTSLGNRNNIDTVGRVSLTRIGADDMMVSWRVNGRHGSERMSPVIGQTCPEVNAEPVSYTGTWSPPDMAVGGTTMMVTAEAQAHIRYYFDEVGVGRWVITSGRGDGPLAEDLDLLELRGFCPGCEESEISIETVGAYSRVYDSEDSATEIFEFQSLPPLNQEYSAEVTTSKLTSRVTCQ
ncbi:S8 family serine peptidase [Wenzhouxiangella sp. XN201]|uniref:S8 family serine peptidase n=1 Tax=Wenzhouxiangella sp. XN201 TaxID=2710755 RepID=UPI0023E38BF8|nr:S8 family serine peptidase [Wenzhouxiangella sp. XN201]